MLIGITIGVHFMDWLCVLIRVSKHTLIFNMLFGTSQDIWGDSINLDYVNITT